MKLSCKKCGAVLEVPPARREAGQRVVCPGCQTEYRLRRKQPSHPSAPPFAATQAPTTPARAAPPLTAATHTPTHAMPATGLGTRTGASAGAVFADGALIAERYRVLRFLARGGMGEVYEVEDLELRGRLALKTVLPHGGEASAIERFKREIHLARKVTHPNVCRIYDFGLHRLELAAEPVVFLTMELLRGETLADHLRRRGHMTPAACGPLVAQMADALEAAHRAGIVHRDLKSENVFLVPDGAGTRLVVTDFGIASGGGGGGDRFAALVTGGGTIGTPAYMAPEQVEGKKATPAADIYAFGVVVYEMVTGHLPFQANDPLSAAVKRLKEPPPPPRTHVPDLDPLWEAVILRCLALDPADRFPSAAAAAAAFATGELTPPSTLATAMPAAAGTTFSAASAVTAPAQTGWNPAASTAVSTLPAMPPAATAAAPDPAVRARQRRLLLALTAVILLSAVLWGWNATKRARDEGRRLVSPRRSIAVLGFANLSGNTADAWLGTALAEMLATELAQGERLRVVPGATVARMRDELDIAAGSELAAESLAAVRALLGCDVVATGSYVTVGGDGGGGRVRLDLKLQDAASATLLDTAAFDAPRAELFDLVSRTGTAIRLRLGADEPRGDRVASLPTEPRAAQLYAEALEHLRASQPLEARDQLLEAARLAPENALVASALSSAWGGLGYQTEAREAAARAFQLAGDLDREDRLMVEGRYREMLADWAAAATVYRALWDYLPDNLDYGLRLAAAETADFKPSAALETVGEMRDLPPPLGSDLRIDLAESAAHGVLSAFEDQLRAASAAAEKARALGASLLLAQAEIARSSALRNLGRQDAAIAAAAAALDIYRRLGNPAGTAEALVNLGNAHYERGELDLAFDHFTAARDAYRTIGNRGGDAAVLGSLALVLRRRGDLERARELYAEAATIFRETGNRPAIANNLNNLATLLDAREQLGEARAMFEESRAIWAEIKSKNGLAYALANIAGVMRRAGELEDSLAAGRQALAVRREIGHPLGEAASLSGLGASHLERGDLAAAASQLEAARLLAEKMDAPAILASILFRQAEVRRQRGELEAARTLHQEALAMRLDLAEPMAVTDSRLALARLLLDEGAAAGAAVEARLAAEACRQQGRPGQAARAGAVLVEALLADGLVREAVAVAGEIASIAERSELARARFEVAIAAARARTIGDAAGALGILGRVRSQTEAAGYRGLALECRLAEVEIAARSIGPERARSLAAAVRDAAEAAGMELIRRRAAALAGQG